MTVRFDDAWRAARSIGQDLGARTGWPVVALRDLIGRVSLVVDDRGHRLGDTDSDAATARMKIETGSFAAATPVLRADDMFAADGIFADPNVIWSSEFVTGQVSLGVAS